MQEAFGHSSIMENEVWPAAPVNDFKGYDTHSRHGVLDLRGKTASLAKFIVWKELPIRAKNVAEEEEERSGEENPGRIHPRASLSSSDKVSLGSRLPRPSTRWASPQAVP